MEIRLALGGEGSARRTYIAQARALSTARILNRLDDLLRDLILCSILGK